MKVAVVTGAIVLGFSMLLLSSVWTSLFRAESSWTEKKALRSVEITNRLVYLGGFVNASPKKMHAGPDPGSAKAEFDALQKEHEKLKAEFESARDNPKTVSKLLKWSGIGLAVIGLFGWYAVKQSL